MRKISPAEIQVVVGGQSDFVGVDAVSRRIPESAKAEAADLLKGLMAMEVFELASDAWRRVKIWVDEKTGKPLDENDFEKLSPLSAHSNQNAY